MITNAAQITVFVKNQEEAKSFYIEKLGFVVCADIELGPGWSYLTVAPNRDNQTMIELVQADTPERQSLIGRQAADQILIMFLSNDIHSDYNEMKARGVVFHGEPNRVPGGWGASFQDLDGNLFDLYQPD